ncbi:MAG: cysteine--tRNA ligase [bacterium]|nr:cysteine--tRNA ligase [bacterium]
MELKFYNTKTRKTEVFKPIEEGKAGLYTCGPTVYNFAHIGNLRSYCGEDVLKRALIYFGYKVRHVMNITDVEDKIIKGCIKENKKASDFTAPYEKAFLEDISSLGIIKADVYPKASEHIPEIVSIIKKLAEKGIAYKGDDGSWYFSIDKFPAYGQLIKLEKEEMKSGVRINNDEYGKDKACDFALWKSWDEKDGDVFWETELGKGRPGWHIECSAMSLKYLGDTFDIHMGGVDNIFPHHENEIAQSEAYTGKTFVNYWVHCEHLLSEGQKMSKSLGNFYTLRDLLEGRAKEGRKFNPLAVRYFYISNHYRTRLNFTLSGLESAEKTLEGIRDFIKRVSETETEDSSYDAEAEKAVFEAKKEFEEKIADDLNTPQALAAIFSMISKINIMASDSRLSRKASEKVLEFMFKADEILGLDLKSAAEKKELEQEIEALIQERQAARKAKNFARADEIRNLLAAQGITLQDTPGGVKWTKK